MAPKRRVDDDLPERWKRQHGAIYYRPRAHEKPIFDGKSFFRLGKNEAEAYKEWAKRMRFDGSEIQRMDKLFERYLLEHVPTLAAKSQKTIHAQMGYLQLFFGNMLPGDVTMQHGYIYLDERGKSAPVSANREMATMRGMMSKAVRWGVVKDNPFLGMEMLKETPRDRYAEDWEVEEFLKGALPLLELYIPIKLMTGLSKADILRIKLSDIREDGLHAKRNKTFERTRQTKVYPLTYVDGTPNELAAAIEDVKTKQRTKKVASLFLFCTRTGQPYVKEDGNTEGFNSIWQRQMLKALKAGKLLRSFTDHDLRAKAATDVNDDEHAQKLLDHTSQEMLRRVYKRKPTIVQPRSLKK